ncbi:hypothetical protein [Sphingobacterium psychroaquaticum]|uniref:Uncharacterized protein n=1 Tax=Sphingobacterium psychroaquaticum TaxID=561061 RepID=A0A1X7JUX8_9SPHI|nr:hypothetical protein [Sphingobacterium psychroaquaticum]SMG32237.1 hypothetical protein SAMN05660862_2239 [Sphingobacterium psychroaquaticum]
MVVPEQYPDRMVFENQHGELVELECRFRPSKGNTFVQMKDGTDVQVSFDIAFPDGTPSILLGTVFNAINERGEIFIYQQQLLSFHVGAFHCLGRC